ncbi:MAG: ATP-binding cassette domain-containing protein, partial [Pikeienuella sp.]
GVGDRDARVTRALSDVALPSSFRYRFPHQLSGGQRQRVAISRELILDPKLLLLDEPTSALDVTVQSEVLNLLNAISAERGLTALFVGHDLGVVAHVCTRILVLEKGELRETLKREALHAGRATHPYTQKLLDAAHRLNVEQVDPPNRGDA